MKKLLLLLTVFAFSVSGLAEEGEPIHDKDEACKEISAGPLKIRSSEEDGILRIEVVENGNVVGAYEPYADGPGSKCLKLKKFEIDGLYLLEACHGITGTSVLIERHSVLVLRLEGKKLSQAGDFEIQNIEREGQVVRTVNDKSYKTKRKDSKALLVLKDKTSKKETEHLF